MQQISVVLKLTVIVERGRSFILKCQYADKRTFLLGRISA